jgi:hypothetical protein
LKSTDNFTASNVEIGPVCCSGDGVVLGNGVVNGPPASNVVLDNLYIHDLYDSCGTVPASIVGQYGCAGQGFGDPCGAPCNSAQHIDGIQALMGKNITVKNSRIYTINPGRPAQGIFFQAINCIAPCFSNLTFENNLIPGIGTLSLGLSGPGTNQVAGYVKVLYNTINGLFRIDSSGANYMMAPGSSVYVVGNILASSSAGVCAIKDGNGSSVSTVWHNNQVPSAASACDPTTDHVGPPAFVSTAPFGPSLHLAGPQWALNHGEATYCPARDFDGDQRPMNGVCDVGADEAG